ncbi:hypothetical protein [Siminovitchia fordii]|uniref:Uncharacterized protein n=1 Tax=Siminovitchia fordii TaxID=254759 RepID=A0ABQ4KCK1_9BACI|nr:hypothetical protein [Siminovitchia fordii]GIN22603.1 hypothetical protein J1TS3_37370 [Siminovitchia fordii]
MIQDEIKEKENEKAVLINKMEEQKKLFLSELVPFLKGWFQNQTKRTIKENADKVVELGEDRAKELKKAIAELIDRTENVVQEYMNDDLIWWHTNEDNVSYYSYDHRLLDKTDKRIREMTGELGDIFIKYEIVKPTSEHSRNYSSDWNKENYGNTKTKYAYSISYSDKLLSINKQYVEMIKVVQDTNKKIEELKEKQKRDNVEEWWDSL